MRYLTTLCSKMLCLAVLGIGCNSDGDSAAVDAAVSDAAVERDSGTADARVGDLAAPTVTSPAANQEVFGRVNIVGTGAPGATISVSLTGPADQALAATQWIADNSGAFTPTLTYSGLVHQDELTLSVRQTLGDRVSPATEVTLVHSAPSSIAGTISQTSGSTGGTRVIVRVYDSNSEDVLDSFVAEQVLTVSADESASGNYEVSVANGTYYVRAFRDSDGRIGEPDGEPTLGGDPQSVARMVVVEGEETNEDLTLVGYEGPVAFERFNAFTVAQTATDFFPRNQLDNLGSGRCGGSYVLAQVERKGDVTDPPKAHMRLPNGVRVELLNDGGCGVAADNTSSSYDQDSSDDRFSYGVPMHDATAGEHVFFYKPGGDATDHIHVERDDVALNFLSRKRSITSPVGVIDVTTPTVSWAAVPGAAAYLVSVDHDEGEIVVPPAPTSLAIGSPLADDSCIQVRVIAYDAPLDEDFDAISTGSEHFFCIDTASDSTVTLSGALVDRTQSNRPILIEVKVGDRRATLTVPSGSNAYAIDVLGGSGRGSVRAVVDTDGSGDLDSPTNNVRARREEIDLSGNLSVDLSLVPIVEFVGPADGTTIGTTPVLSWVGYNTTAGGIAPDNFVHLVFLSDFLSQSEFPSVMFAVPEGTTSLDLSTVEGPSTAHVDVAMIAACIDGGGTSMLAANGAQTCPGGYEAPSPVPLRSGVPFGWGMFVLECTYPDFANSAQVTAFLACVADVFEDPNGFAQSLEHVLVTED